MKESIRLVAVLTAICSISAAMLAAVYNITMGPINRALEKKIAQATADVMPVGAPKAGIEKLGGEPFYVSRADDGTLVAVAIESVSSNGYGGEIKMMVGLGADKTLIGYSVISSKETAGLGTKIAEDDFMGQLVGKPFSSDWRVRKDGGDFDAVTSATISSRAALECIREAMAKYEEVLPELN